MNYSLENFENISFDEYDLDLRQKEVDGGKITFDQIDTIKEFPSAQSIVISGLEDDTFEYFITKYANQFRLISFWKNKNLTNLRALEKINNIEFLMFFYNTKVQQLWNMKNNLRLEGLCVYNFTKLHSIDGIEYCPSLKYFSFGNEAGNSNDVSYLESFRKLKETNINHFGWYGNDVLDGDYRILSETKINRLDMNPRRFTVEELTDLLSLFPETLTGTVTIPYSLLTIKENENETQIIYPCKGKRVFTKGKDDLKFNKYIDEFNNMLVAKRNEKTHNKASKPTNRSSRFAV